MLLRRSSIIILCGVALFLSGCGGSRNMQPVTFQQFSFEIPESFQTVPTSLVENKQILHKVLKSFKLPTEEGIFSPNVVITSTALLPSIDYEQFWTANTNKLKQDLQGYKADKKELFEIVCGEDEIQGIYVQFEITDTFSARQQTYYMAQYQYVYKEQGYIISYATGDPDDHTLLRKWISTLGCL